MFIDYTDSILSEKMYEWFDRLSPSSLQDLQLLRSVFGIIYSTILSATANIYL